MKNITKWQHIVPQFYLKEFKNEKNLIENYDILNKQFGQPKGTRPLCADYFYYGAETGIQDEISQIVEEFLESIETPLSKSIPKLKKSLVGNSEITPEEKHIISLLMSMLYIRNNTTRNQIKQTTSNFTLEVLKGIANVKGEERFFNDYERDTGIIISSSEKKNFFKALQESTFKIEVNNAPHINFLSKIPNFANILNTQNWIIYISKIEENFITSDTPVISKNPKNWNNKFGVPILSKSYYFPLSPKIFIKTYYDGQITTKSIKRKNLLSKKDTQIINDLNLVIASQSEKQLFAYQKIDIEKILKYRQ
ncbi:DUF4238 domain-containing protein [Leptospira bouyouniensis]|uniref:DUF4238 domain-containing protein n=1 Tax=Leptospira bouyouniensis TaxID=2484911 RepID=UPI0010918380|nr:DUF4238 domain-containing protein [Leptospira bouyouniensis]TGM88696.1 DUF4238 domain-containing protein [Leptospira bouyouniensis]